MFQLRGISRPCIVLLNARRVPGRNELQRFKQPSGSNLRQAVMQRSTVVVRQHFATALQQDIASVESFVHIHHGDARLTIARRDCGLNPRRAPPARNK